MLSSFRILLIFMILSIVGLALLPKVAVDLQPAKPSYTLQISCFLPNSSPEVVEEQVTSVLENVFSGLSDVEKISSKSGYNSAIITILLSKNAKKEFKKMELAALIRQIYPKLPKNASFPVINETSDNKNQKMPILSYSVIAPFSSLAIRNIAENSIKSTISLNPSIEKVEITGANEQEIVVEYDLQKLNAYQITKNTLQNIIQKNSSEQFLGVYEDNQNQRFFVKTKNELANITEIGNIPIKNNLKLYDFAKIYISEQQPQSFFRINGLNLVRMSIYARPNANNLQLAKEIKNEIENIEKSLPKGYQAILEYDTTKEISEELNKIYLRTGVSMLILMVFIFLTNFNWRYLLVLMLGIVVNLCLTMILVYVFKIQLHLYSLAGLTISFGMIVDNAVVMLDHLRKKGDKSVFKALLGATITTLAALALVFLLPEEDRQNLSDFSLIIVVNLGISLLVALFFTPAMYEVFFKAERLERHFSKKIGDISNEKTDFDFQKVYFNSINFIGNHSKKFNFMLILLFGTPIFLLPSKIENNDFYNATLGHEFYQDYIRKYTDKALGGSLRLFVNEVYEKSGYRSPMRTQLYVSAEMPHGTTLDQMNDIITKSENYLKTVKGIDKFVTNIYSGTDASLTISFLPDYPSLPYELKSQIVSQSIDWGGVEWGVYGVGESFSNAQHEQIANFRVEMRGYNYLELERQSNILAKKLSAHKRIQKVNTNELLTFGEKKAKQFALLLDNQTLQIQNVRNYDIFEGLQMRTKANNGAFYVFYENKQMPVLLQETNASKFSAFQLSNEIVSLSPQKSIKMKQFSTLNLETTVATLHKENRQYIRMIGFDYYGGYKFGQDFLNKKLAEMKQEMPAGYSTKQQEWSFGKEKAKRQYGLLLILGVAIFVICSILFESFKQPFLILLQIPLALSGAFFTFGLGEFYFDQGGYAAFVLLGGLSVNAAIFVVNDFNQLLVENKNNHNDNDNQENITKEIHNNLIIKAIWQKANPIFLSVFSTILGLIPFLTEGNNEVFWFAMAVGTIGGLLASLLGVFVVLPVWLWKK